MVASLAKLRPEESISIRYLSFEESVAYRGFDQLRISATLLESAGWGVMIFAVSVSTADFPFAKVAEGRSPTLLQATARAQSVVTRMYVRKMCRLSDLMMESMFVD